MTTLEFLYGSECDTWVDLQQHTTGYHHKKLLIKSSSESVETGILTLDVTSFRFNGNDIMERLLFTLLSVCELVNQVDGGLKWLTIQEDIQSYQSFQGCHSGTVSHVKSSSFPIFLYSCNTNSGQESLGMQLVVGPQNLQEPKNLLRKTKTKMI